uniref:Uncharacterized protein n=2 Tax=Schistocephalus solidus TaxID=70667 RepID=A0A0V0J8J3_SCHSO
MNSQPPGWSQTDNIKIKIEDIPGVSNFKASLTIEDRQGVSPADQSTNTNGELERDEDVKFSIEVDGVNPEDPPPIIVDIQGKLEVPGAEVISNDDVMDLAITRPGGGVDVFDVTVDANSEYPGQPEPADDAEVVRTLSYVLTTNAIEEAQRVVAGGPGVDNSGGRTTQLIAEQVVGAAESSLLESLASRPPKTQSQDETSRGHEASQMFVRVFTPSSHEVAPGGPLLSPEGRFMIRASSEAHTVPTETSIYAKIFFRPSSEVASGFTTPHCTTVTTRSMESSASKTGSSRAASPFDGEKHSIKLMAVMAACGTDEVTGGYTNVFDGEQHAAKVRAITAHCGDNDDELDDSMDPARRASRVLAAQILRGAERKYRASMSPSWMNRSQSTVDRLFTPSSHEVFRAYSHGISEASTVPTASTMSMKPPAAEEKEFVRGPPLHRMTTSDSQDTMTSEEYKPTFDGEKHANLVKAITATCAADEGDIGVVPPGKRICKCKGVTRLVDIPRGAIPPEEARRASRILAAQILQGAEERYRASVEPSRLGQLSISRLFTPSSHEVFTGPLQAIPKAAAMSTGSVTASRLFTPARRDVSIASQPHRLLKLDSKSSMKFDVHEGARRESKIIAGTALRRAEERLSSIAAEKAGGIPPGKRICVCKGVTRLVNIPGYGLPQNDAAQRRASRVLAEKVIQGAQEKIMSTRRRDLPINSVSLLFTPANRDTFTASVSQARANSVIARLFTPSMRDIAFGSAQSETYSSRGQHENHYFGSLSDPYSSKHSDFSSLIESPRPSTLVDDQKPPSGYSESTAGRRHKHHRHRSHHKEKTRSTPRFSSTSSREIVGHCSTSCCCSWNLATGTQGISQIYPSITLMESLLMSSNMLRTYVESMKTGGTMQNEGMQQKAFERLITLVENIVADKTAPSEGRDGQIDLKKCEALQKVLEDALYSISKTGSEATDEIEVLQCGHKEAVSVLKN